MALPWITGLGIQAEGGGAQGAVEPWHPCTPHPTPSLALKRWALSHWDPLGPLAPQPSSPPLTLVLDALSLIGCLAACTPTSRVPRSDLEPCGPVKPKVRGWFPLIPVPPRPGTQQVSGPVIPSMFFTQNSHEHELDPHSQSLVCFLHSPNKQGQDDMSIERAPAFKGFSPSPSPPLPSISLPPVLGPLGVGHRLHTPFNL